MRVRLILAAVLLSAAVYAAPDERTEIYRQAVNLYEHGMYERAANLLDKIQGDPMSDGYAVLCAIKMQSEGFEDRLHEYERTWRRSSISNQIDYEYALVLFDRGYPSAHLIEELENAGLKYAMRCSSEFLRSVRYSGNDCIVTHQFLAIRRPMRLRIVQVILNNGETEYIVTNLFDKGLTVKDFQQLYHFRWGIETNYNTMKHKLRMEDFTGHTVDAVLQDFYATLTSVNLLACIIHDNLKEIEEMQKDSGNKYPYIQNINQTIGMMRNRLLEIVAAKSPRRRNMLYRKLLAETRRNLVPVRSGRSFPRGVRHKSAHYSHNTKQA